MLTYSCWHKVGCPGIRVRWVWDRIAMVRSNHFGKHQLRWRTFEIEQHHHLICHHVQRPWYLIQQWQTRLSFITWAQLAFTWEYYCWIQMVLCLLTSSFSSCWHWQYVARVMFQNTELHDWSLVGRCDYLLWAQFIDNRQLILGIKALPMLVKVCAIQSSQQQTLTCHLYILAGFFTHLLLHRSHIHFAIAPFE